MDNEERVRVVFELTVSDDGYPPYTAETLWARRREDGFLALANVPFFVLGLSSADVIEARPTPGGAHEFVRLVERGGHSTVRLLVRDEADVPRVGENLRALGCGTERFGPVHPRLLAVDIPPAAVIADVQALLRAGAHAGRFEVDEANVPESFDLGLPPS